MESQLKITLGISGHVLAWSEYFSLTDKVRSMAKMWTAWTRLRPQGACCGCVDLTR